MIICKRPDPLDDHLQTTTTAAPITATTTTTTGVTGGHQSDRGHQGWTGVTGQREEKKEKEKEEKREKEEEEEKKLAHKGRDRTDQSKVVQKVLTDLNNSKVIARQYYNQESL